MGIKYRKEDEADKWLRENDPYYTNKSGHKSKTLKHPYDTARQERTKAETEIPFSNLNKSQKVQMKDYVGAFDDSGNFEI
jgi:hypothetical protein